MQTLYIDIYFLINFTMDALVLYFALRLTRATSNIVRLLLSAALLALLTCLYTLFLTNHFLGFVLLLSGYLISIRISTGKISLIRYLCLCLFFFVLSLLFGGIIYWGYGQLEILLKNLKIDTNSGAENQKLLRFSVLILICICIVRLFIIFFEHTKGHKSAHLSFVLFDKKYEMDVLVDSGNLLKDPLSDRPVALIKSLSLSLPINLWEDIESGEIMWDCKKRIRLIPVKTIASERMMVGFLVDECSVSIGKKEQKINICIAIDREGGSYGGYVGLIPSTILDYAN